MCTSEEALLLSHFLCPAITENPSGVSESRRVARGGVDQGAVSNVVAALSDWGRDDREAFRAWSASP